MPDRWFVTMEFWILVVALGLVLGGAGLLLRRRLGGRGSREPGGTPRGYVVHRDVHHANRDAQNPDAHGFADENDAAVLDGIGRVGVIADGIGRPDYAGRASETAVRAFLDALERGPRARGSGASTPTVLADAFTEAHAAVRKLAEGNGIDGRLGTTVAAVAIGPYTLHWIAAGDSRVYLFRDGSLHQVTVDQNFGTLLARRVFDGQLSPDDAAAKQNRDALTSFAGADEDTPEVDASRRPFRLRPGDRVILCTDGVHTALSPTEMRDTLRAAGADCAEALVRDAVEQSPAEENDVTVMTFEIRPESERVAPDAEPDGPTPARPQETAAPGQAEGQTTAPVELPAKPVGEDGR